METQIDNWLSMCKQLSIGELIQDLKKRMFTDRDKEKTVVFDFGFFRPGRIQSWKGDFEHLAIDYTDEGEVSLWVFIEMLDTLLGDTMENHGGGRFTIEDTTPLWVAKPGDVGKTAVVGTLEDDDRVFIVTAWKDY